jgi:cell wall-associated NlpC family hydrolase
MVTRTQIVDEARKWKNVRWRHEGRNEHGIDCVGLPAVVAWKLGISDYDFHGYAREPSNLSLLKHFRLAMIEKPVAQVQIGDVVAFRDNRYPFHVGIIANKYDQLSVIHAYAARKKVVEELYNPEWSKLVLACFEFPGVEDS